MTDSYGAFDQTPFEYEKLPSFKHIRLIRLGSPEKTSPISIELIVTNLGKTPPYYVLSYCWGAQSAKVVIFVNRQRLLVSENLHQALVRLRERHDGDQIVLDHGSSQRTKTHYGESTDYIWIDQICINQSDIHERGQQVSIMQSIYSEAVRTIIWLGDFVEDSDERPLEYVSLLHDSLQQYIEEATRSEQSFMDVHERLGTETLVHGLPLPVPTNKKEFQFFKTIYTATWFQRVWVVQEVILSPGRPVIMLGDSRMNWDDFAQLSRTLDTYRLFGAGGSGLLHTIIIQDWPLARLRGQQDQRDTNSHLGMLEVMLLDVAWRMAASDPRDKVYALSGLISENENGKYGQAPDYMKPFREVYRDAVLGIIRTSGSLLLLSRGAPLSTEHCPSTQCDLSLTWVPKWEGTYTDHQPRSISYITMRRSNSITKAVHSGPQAPKTTALGRSAQLWPQEDVNMLVLKALFIDSIVWCSELIEDAGLVGHHYARAMAAAGLKPDFGPAHLLFVQSFARCWIGSDRIRKHVVADEEVSRYYADTDDENICWLFDLLAHWYDSGSSGLSSNEDVIQSKECRARAFAAPSFFAKKAGLGGCKMFLTATGYLGYGAASMLPSDDIFILFGGPFCSILRKCQEQNHFVGEACLPDFMDGHAVEEWDEGKRKAQWVTIR